MVQFLRYEDRIFCHFGPFFALWTSSTAPLLPRKLKFGKNEKSIWRCHHFKLVQQKVQSYDVCLLRYGMWQDIISCHFRSFFALLPHYWPWKFTHITINQDHIMHGSWDMKCNRQNLSSWAIVCPFTPPPPKQPKNENIKNEKKPWRYHDFTQVYQKPWPSAHSVHPPLPLFCCGVWASYQIFKKGGGLTGPLFLEQVAGKEGGDFFQGGLQFFNKK